MALNIRQRAVAIVEPLIFLLLDFYGQIKLVTSKCSAIYTSCSSYLDILRPFVRSTPATRIVELVQIYESWFQSILAFTR